MNLRRPAIDPIWLHRLCLRGLAIALLVCCSWGSVASQAFAGCHYGDGRHSHQVKVSENPREHARNFTFLGQWVYERGEIKYVPWQGNPPCHGPSCQADKPLPVSTGSPATSVYRLPSVVLVSVKSNPFRFDGGADWLSHEDCEPLTGFAQEHEHPPRVTGC